MKCIKIPIYNALKSKTFHTVLLAFKTITILLNGKMHFYLFIISSILTENKLLYPVSSKGSHKNQQQLFYTVWPEGKSAFPFSAISNINTKKKKDCHVRNTKERDGVFPCLKLSFNSFRLCLAVTLCAFTALLYLESH